MSGDVATLEKVEPQAPSEEKPSLKEKNSGLAARFRQLGKIQSERTLTGEELEERKPLERMSCFGLFQELSEDQLRSLEVAYQKAEAQALADPQSLRVEYNALVRKQRNQTLGPKDLSRYNYLSVLGRQGMI